MELLITIPYKTGNVRGWVMQLNDGSLLHKPEEYLNYNLLKSDDGGATWRVVFDGIKGGGGGSHLAKNGYIYVGDSGIGVPAKLHRSRDNGESWEEVLQVESSTISWQIGEDTKGRLYIAEYSNGSEDSAELYGYNAWTSTDDGSTWRKFYTFPSQTVPGAKADGIRHLHIAGADSNDNVYLTTGERNYSPWGGRSFQLNSSGVITGELTKYRTIGESSVSDNGYTTFVEAENGNLIFGGDGSPYRIVTLDPTTFEILSQVTMEGVYSPFNSEFMTSCIGKDGVVYVATKGSSTIERIIAASYDDGITWVIMRYIGVQDGGRRLSCNLNVPDSRVFINHGDNSGGSNYTTIKDYTRAELELLTKTSRLTINRA